MNSRIINILAFMLMLAGATTAAAQQPSMCARTKPVVTTLKINLETPPPHLDLRQSREQINRGREASHESWIRQNGMESVWQADRMETLGHAAGGWAMAASIANRAEPVDVLGSTWCPYFGPVELNLFYRTIITIPNEFKPGSCAYNVIMAHEMKHHETNVKVVQETVARLKRDFPAIIRDIEGNAMVYRPQVEPRFKYMQSSLQAAMQVYLKETMQAQMISRNRLIDTPAEYEQTGKQIEACQP